MKLDRSLMRIARRCRRHCNYHRTPAQRAELRERILSLRLSAAA